MAHLRQGARTLIDVEDEKRVLILQKAENQLLSDCSVTPNYWNYYCPLQDHLAPHVPFTHVKKKMEMNESECVTIEENKPGTS